LPKLLTLFWNPAENRLRLAWRLAGLGLLLLITLPFFQAAAALAGSALFPPPSFSWDSPLTLVVLGLASGLAVALSVALAARVLDRRRFQDLGFQLSPPWGKDFGLGLGLGALLMTLIFGAELALGWIEIRGVTFSPNGFPAFPGGLALSTLFYLAVGFYEELFSRGYLIKNLSEGLAGGLLGPRAAVLLAWILTSLLFGALHGPNPNATLLGVANISLAGLLMGAGYLLTGQLALPIGLHISWNLFQGPIFGFPVSGASLLGHSVFQVKQLGPVLWTGGAFGPEGGLLGTLTILLGLALVLLWKGSNGLQLELSRYQPRQAPGDQPSSPPPERES
jgi:membrane protease YdiL (CAAX protease family)